MNTTAIVAAAGNERTLSTEEPNMNLQTPGQTDERVLMDSSFTAVVNAPLENIDIPAWCFGLPDHEYQACSPAHFAAGATTSRDGRRMSINVEVIGGTLIIEHYVEKLAERHHLVLESLSDIFTPAGRSTILVTWEMSVSQVNDGQCEFTNHVISRATEDLWNLLARQGIPFEIFRAQRQPMSIAHNRQETPYFAASIERHALASAQ